MWPWAVVVDGDVVVDEATTNTTTMALYDAMAIGVAVAIAVAVAITVVRAIAAAVAFTAAVAVAKKRESLQSVIVRSLI